MERVFFLLRTTWEGGKGGEKNVLSLGEGEKYHSNSLLAERGRRGGNGSTL